MGPETLLRLLRSDGETLLVAAATDPAADVWTCPGWDMTTLVLHVGGVHRWAAEIVRSGARVRRSELPHPGDGAPFEEVAEWYAAGLDVVCSTLAAADPDDPAWNFGSSEDHRAAWWLRRQAAETAVHRWDAQHAVDPASARPIDESVAVAGITEHLAEFLPGVARREGVALHGTLHLHATGLAADSEGGEWLIDFDAEPLAVSTGHAKADTAIRGTASDLFLWIWNRLGAGGAGLDVFGSAEPLTIWPLLTL